MMRKAREIMSKNVEVIREDETILEAARRLTDLGVGAMPICDGDRLQGMLTDRDIVTKVVAEDRDPNEVTVRELETGKPLTIGADDSVETAMQTISQADLAKALPKDLTGELVAAISSD